MKILPIYDRFFRENGISENEWSSFRTDPDSKDIVVPSVVDFEIVQEKSNWKERAKAICLLILKFVIFPWIFYEGIKSLVGKIVMWNVLPAQLRSNREVDGIRKKLVQSVFKKDVIVRHVSLGKNGIKYRGILVGLKENILNGNWAMLAVGNNIAVEHSLPEEIYPFIAAKFNILLINEPNVGRSEGPATVENMGHSQDVGISFLESAIKAKRIALCGFSIGGASLGKGVLMHTFRENIKYIVVRMMTFDRLSRIAENVMGFIGKGVIHWLDYEMDSVAASKKLMDLGIPEVVIQADKDEVMSGIELGTALEKEGILENKEFITVPDSDHNFFPDQILYGAIQKWFPVKSSPSLRERLSNKMGFTG